MIDFKVEGQSGVARAGILGTPHGEIHTPAFMPVATQASVKALSGEEVSSTGTRLLIMNTYHLWLRPGAEVIAAQGGLHKFSRWPHAIATDSGGFQAFSLAERVKIEEHGIEFSSHLDGRRLTLSPEEAMRVQGLLGSDIALQLDVCPPGGAPHSEIAAAVARTSRWAERCLSAKSPEQALFAIVQGGTDVELRLEHAERQAALPVAGLALGGFSVGEPTSEMRRTLAVVGPRLDARRPRYLMGVGTPLDILHAVGCGIDLFDCVMPTRNARNGQAFTRTGRLVIKNAQFRRDERPIEEGCSCEGCRVGYSRAYLRHLYLASEILPLRILTLHNLEFYARLMQQCREAVLRGDFAGWAARWVAHFQTGSREAGDCCDAESGRIPELPDAGVQAPQLSPQPSHE